MTTLTELLLFNNFEKHESVKAQIQSGLRIDTLCSNR